MNFRIFFLSFTCLSFFCHFVTRKFLFKNLFSVCCFCLFAEFYRNNTRHFHWRSVQLFWLPQHQDENFHQRLAYQFIKHKVIHWTWNILFPFLPIQGHILSQNHFYSLWMSFDFMLLSKLSIVVLQLPFNILIFSF